MDIDPNSPGSGPGSRSQADFPFDSLVDTFPFLTDQAHRALNIQLDFFRNLSTMDLPIPQDANAKEKLKVILAKAELVNEIVKSLTESSELLMQLKNIEYDEVIAARHQVMPISQHSIKPRHILTIQYMPNSQHIPSPNKYPYKDKTAYTPNQAPQALTTLRFE
nr:hypothetical protein FVER53263_20144 [Fusarium verticillioides]